MNIWSIGSEPNMDSCPVISCTNWSMDKRIEDDIAVHEDDDEMEQHPKVKKQRTVKDSKQNKANKRHNNNSVRYTWSDATIRV